MPPRAEQLFPSDGWLEAIARSGYTDVCLQYDHFFHPEMELRDYGENVCRLFILFDFVSGPRRRTYQAWLAAVDRLCGDFGLKLAVELWEPGLSRLARRVLPAEWMGPAHPAGWYQMLCVGPPDARRWLLDGCQSFLRVAPCLDTVILGINDNSALLCDERCPRCAREETVESWVPMAFSLTRRPVSAAPGDFGIHASTGSEAISPDWRLLSHRDFAIHGSTTMAFSLTQRPVPAAPGDFGIHASTGSEAVSV